MTDHNDHMSSSPVPLPSAEYIARAGEQKAKAALSKREKYILVALAAAVCIPVCIFGIVVFAGTVFEEGRGTPEEMQEQAAAQRQLLAFAAGIRPGEDLASVEQRLDQIDDDLFSVHRYRGGEPGSPDLGLWQEAGPKLGDPWVLLVEAQDQKVVAVRFRSLSLSTMPPGVNGSKWGQPPFFSRLVAKPHDIFSAYRSEIHDRFRRLRITELS
ncbi:MAG TPA: hypothetical protein HPP77_06505 [Candidatus Hydrogenedentes bacterium]|nr:hypothetical protein [Candidatus Hydrogenedentota bacterium]